MPTWACYFLLQCEEEGLIFRKQTRKFLDYSADITNRCEVVEYVMLIVASKLYRVLELDDSDK